MALIFNFYGPVDLNGGSAIVNGGVWVGAADNGTGLGLVAIAAALSQPHWAEIVSVAASTVVAVGALTGIWSCALRCCKRRANDPEEGQPAGDNGRGLWRLWWLW